MLGWRTIVVRFGTFLVRLLEGKLCQHNKLWIRMYEFVHYIFSTSFLCIRGSVTLLYGLWDWVIELPQWGCVTQLCWGQHAVTTQPHTRYTSDYIPCTISVPMFNYS